MNDSPPSDSQRLSNSTMAVQTCLDRLSSDESGAFRDLLSVSINRLRVLARKILADIPAVKRWDSTDDLLQNASLRLWKAIETHHPPTPTDFFRLAACVMRRELIDLSRSHYGPLGWGANHHSPKPSDSSVRTEQGQLAASDSNSPDLLSEWTEFHTYIENLPDDERQLFDLLWYQGLTLNETSELLGIPLRTLGRAWKVARIRLAETLLGSLSGT
jgi:RNA polymerase sigma factor (sigma-70 family)